jgi:hypothetical protein
MPTSSILDVALGLVFVFATTAAISSVITELIARFLGLKGQYLLRGIRELVDADVSEVTNLKSIGDAYTDFQEMAAANSKAPSVPAATQGSGSKDTTVKQSSATSALLGSPLILSPGMAGLLSSRAITLGPNKRPDQPATMTSTGWDLIRRNRRSLPPYISPQMFASGVIDLVVPNANGQTTMADVAGHVDAIPDQFGSLKGSLQALVKNAGGDVDAFRHLVEQWYDDHMNRVSGWYKRRVAKITLVVGALLVILLNINALSIARTLYTESDVRAAVSAVAGAQTQCPAGQGQLDCLKALQEQLKNADETGLPVGWPTVAECSTPNARCSFWEAHGIVYRGGGLGLPFVLMLIGFLITITALVPGARFWYDLLGKLGSQSTSGPKPTSPRP